MTTPNIAGLLVDQEHADAPTVQKDREDAAQPLSATTPSATPPTPEQQEQAAQLLELGESALRQAAVAPFALLARRTGNRAYLDAATARQDALVGAIMQAADVFGLLAPVVADPKKLAVGMLLAAYGGTLFDGFTRPPVPFKSDDKDGGA